MPTRFAVRNRVAAMFCGASLLAAAGETVLGVNPVADAAITYTREAAGVQRSLGLIAAK